MRLPMESLVTGESPVDALMYDFNDSHALAIPPPRTVSAMIPETARLHVRRCRC